MEIVLFRFIIVWIALHILLFFVEWWKYKNSSFNLKWFLKDRMFIFTYLILSIDIILIIFFVGKHLIFWILQPII